jgi:hypothetical protein
MKDLDKIAHEALEAFKDEKRLWQGGPDYERDCYTLVRRPPMRLRYLDNEAPIHEELRHKRFVLSVPPEVVQRFIDTEAMKAASLVIMEYLTSKEEENEPEAF